MSTKEQRDDKVDHALMERATITLQSYADAPNDDLRRKEAIVALKDLANSASFGTTLREELGYDDDIETHLNAMFALRVIAELSVAKHHALVDLSKSIKTIDGPTFAELVLAGFHRLGAGKDELNKINVFPVPDGDTGTNMYNCLKEPSRSLFTNTPLDVRDIARRLADEVVQHGQGNSGTILAHFFISLSEEITTLNATAIDVEAFARAIARAGARVSNAVQNPKDGTLVSVARDCCAKIATFKGNELTSLMRTWADAAAVELARTPDQLVDKDGKYVLKDAGVVDSGAKGFALIVEGMALACEGKFEAYVRSPTQYWDGSRADQEDASTFKTLNETYSADSKFRYCTEVVIRLAEGKTKDDITAAFDKSDEDLGDSLVCIGGAASSTCGAMAKIHIHCNEPDKVISLVLTFSATTVPLKEKINDMYQQVKDEREEALDSAKMNASKVKLMLDGCILPPRYLKHCALCPIWILHGGKPLRLGETHTYDVNFLCNKSRTHFEPLETGAPLPLQAKRKLELALRNNDTQLVCAIIAAAASATYRNVVSAIKMLPDEMQKRIHLYDRSATNVSTGYLGNNSTMGLEALRVIERGNATVDDVIERMRHVDDRLYSICFLSSNTVSRLAKWRPKLFWWIHMLPQLNDVKVGSGTMEDPYAVKDGYSFAAGLYPSVAEPGKERDPRTKMANFMRWSAHRPRAERDKLKREELEKIKASLKPGQVIRDFVIQTTIRVDRANAFAELVKTILPCKEDPMVTDPTLVTAALLGYDDLWAFYWIGDGKSSK